MPTLNPRLTITLTPAVVAVLRELAELGGQSQSSIVGELLETTLPVFERVVFAMRAASTIQASANAEIASGLERAQAKLEDQLGLMLDDVDETLRPLLKEAGKVTRRGAGVGAAGRALARTDAPKKAPERLTTPVPLTGGSGHPKRRKTRETTSPEQAMPSGGWQGVDESWKDYQARLEAAPKGNKRGGV